MQTTQKGHRKSSSGGSEYDVQVNYKPSKEMYLADTLSRAHLQERPNATSSSEEVLAIDEDDPRIQETLKVLDTMMTIQ